MSNSSFYLATTDDTFPYYNVRMNARISRVEPVHMRERAIILRYYWRYVLQMFIS